MSVHGVLDGSDFDRRHRGYPLVDPLSSLPVRYRNTVGAAAVVPDGFGSFGSLRLAAKKRPAPPHLKTVPETRGGVTPCGDALVDPSRTVAVDRWPAPNGQWPMRVSFACWPPASTCEQDGHESRRYVDDDDGTAALRCSPVVRLRRNSSLNDANCFSSADYCRFSRQRVQRGRRHGASLADGPDQKSSEEDGDRRADYWQWIFGSLRLVPSSRTPLRKVVTQAAVLDNDLRSGHSSSAKSRVPPQKAGKPTAPVAKEAAPVLQLRPFAYSTNGNAFADHRDRTPQDVHVPPFPATVWQPMSNASQPVPTPTPTPVPSPCSSLSSSSLSGASFRSSSRQNSPSFKDSSEKLEFLRQQMSLVRKNDIQIIEQLTRMERELRESRNGNIDQSGGCLPAPHVFRIPRCLST